MMRVYLVICMIGFLAGCNPSGGTSAYVDTNPWEAVEVEGPKCGNGTDVNMAVNRASAHASEPSNKLVLFLQGGGACWDGVTCSTENATAINIDKTMFDWTVRLDANSNSLYGIGDRSDIDNTFRNDNFAYIPYCTGDVHSGSLTTANADTGILHRGGQNLLDFIEQPNGVLDQFPDTEEVFLIGASAGGFGTIAMYETVSTAFGAIPVHLLSDGGIPISATHAPSISPDSVVNDWDGYTRSMSEFQIHLIETWGMSQFLPEANSNTITDFGAIFDYNTTLNTSRRHGVITSLDDKVIQQFIHAGLFGPVYTYIYFNSDPKYTVADWRNAVNDTDTYLAEIPNAHMWIRNDSTHVYIGDNLLLEAGGVSLADWLSDFRSGADTWATVKDVIPE